jgi:hypothetical protein
MVMLHFWMGLGAAQKGSKSQPADKRSIIIGAVIAGLAIAGLAFFLVSKLHF